MKWFRIFKRYKCPHARETIRIDEVNELIIFTCSRCGETRTIKYNQGRY